jgi:hypothetical protein
MIEVAESQEIPKGEISFSGWPLGENTSVPARLLKPQELEKCVDFKFNPGGQLETRPPVIQYTDTDINEIHDIKTCIVSGTARTLISAGDAVNGYYIYYLDGTTPTEIGEVDGAATITAYNDVALICDGSYLKYIDGITEIKQAYDDGTSGTFYDNYTGDSDDVTAVSTTGVGCKFTTPDWGTLTIPPTSVWAKVQESGGTASLEAEIVEHVGGDETVDTTDVGDAGSTASITFEYDVTGLLKHDKIHITLPESAVTRGSTEEFTYQLTADYVEATLETALNDNGNWDTNLSGTFSVVANQLVFTYDANGEQTDLDDAAMDVMLVMAVKAYTGTVPSASADYIRFIFSTVRHELSPDTTYYCLISGTNCNISHTTVTSGGTLITAGNTLDTTKDPIMRVHPGIPPKADWAVVSNTRPFIYDPDYPGALYYGNLTHLDFSTVDGGGYLTTIDDSRSSFEIGGAQDLYGELFVYGTQDQPFLCKLTGSSPSAYELPLMFQRVWTLPTAIENTGSDIWTASKDGVDALSGVQEYGDLRTFSVSDPIKDQLEDNWSSTTFTGYHPLEGQLWVYMPGATYVNICHTKQPIRDQAGKVRYPWTRYDLPVTPTCFAYTTEGFLIGADDGYVYNLDSTEYKDLTTTHIHPTFKTPRVDMPGRYFNTIMVQFSAYSVGGTGFDMDIYINGSDYDSINTWEIALPMSDSLTVDDLTMDIDDMLFAIAPTSAPSFTPLNFNCFAVQVEISDVHIADYPVFFNGLTLTYRSLEQ